MERLDHISNEELWELLDEIDGSTEAQRVLAAIAFKQGDSTSRLAERHNVSQQTIRNWLSRFEDRPLDKAPFDDERTGRPRKLSDEEQEQLVNELRDSPQKVGFEHRSGSLGWYNTTSKANTASSIHFVTSGV